MTIYLFSFDEKNQNVFSSYFKGIDRTKGTQIYLQNSNRCKEKIKIKNPVLGTNTAIKNKIYFLAIPCDQIMGLRNVCRENGKKIF